MSSTPRVHFLDEQRRHRRTSAASAALVVAALAVSGIPLSILISPLLVALVAVPVRVADLVMDVPAALTAWLDRAFHLLPTIWSAVRRPDVDLPWDWLVGLFVLPGVFVILLFRALVRLTFRRTGVGGVLRRMEPRPPRPGDLAEQRLANLVQEVAVAAGVPPPRVALIDTPAAPDPAPDVGARLAAARGAFLPTARASLALVGRIGWQTLRERGDASSRELALDRLLEGAGYEHDMGSEELEMLPDLHPLVLLFGYLPLLLTVAVLAIIAKAVIWLTALLTGPFVALLWRTRRRLADATAVQLTRYPEALAGALKTLAGLDVTVPSAVVVHFLFPVWDPAVDRDDSRTDVTSALLRMQLPLAPRLRRLERLGTSAEHRPAGPTAAAGEAAREFAAGLGWLAVAALFLGGLLALSAVAAAAVLYVLGWLLHALLVAMPRWIAGLWR